MKTVGVTDYTSQTTPKHFGWKKCLSSTLIKMRKYLSNVHKMGGAHLQYVLSHYAKLEYKGMKTFGVTQTRHHKSVVDRQTDTGTDRVDPLLDLLWLK